MNLSIESENRKLHKANVETRALLDGVAGKLRAILQDECIMEDVPTEAGAVMAAAAKAIEAALHRLAAVGPVQPPAAVRIPGGPTRQQGQFLAFIREYLTRNHAGVAPTHAAFQRFFNLTPPSVNSMLIRLEQRGFIRRIPHTPRAIELTIAPEWIPPLERPFKF